MAQPDHASTASKTRAQRPRPQISKKLIVEQFVNQVSSNREGFPGRLVRSPQPLSPSAHAGRQRHVPVGCQTVLV